MNSVANLMREAAERLSEADAAFSDHVNVVEDILRSYNVVASRRLAVNGEYHRTIAAALVLAHESAQPFILPTRYQGALHQAGLSTTLVSILDNAVEADLIRSDDPSNRAKGPLRIGELISSYLPTPATSNTSSLA